jgi:voltage-gated potassium channel Kch
MPSSKEKTNKVTLETRPRRRTSMRVKLWVKDHQWHFLFGLSLVALVLGCIGFKKHYKIGPDLGILDVCYRSLQLFVLHSIDIPPKVPWQLEIARFLAPSIAFYAVVVILMRISREQVQLLRLRFIKDHIIICGLGRIGTHLARAFRESGHRVAVIEKNPENENLAFCREHKIIHLIGDATDQRRLCQAKIEKAKYLFSVCYHDGTNAEVALLAHEIVQSRNKRMLTSFIHIMDLELCKLLREKKILEQRVDVFRWEFFNIFETGARALLNSFPPFEQLGGLDDDRAHMLIVGLGHMGESLVMRAIRDWRDLHKNDDKRFKITMIDKQASTLKESLSLRYPQINKYCDLQTHQLESQTSEFLRNGFLLNLDVSDPTIVYICSDDDAISFSSAIALHRYLTARGKRIPIVVRITERTGLAKFLSSKEEGAGEFENLQTFDLLKEVCQPDLLLRGVNEILAQAMHDDYVRSEKRKGETPVTNPSIVRWELLSEDLKESNRYEADYFVERLKPYGYRIVPLTDWKAESLAFPLEIVEEMAKIEHKRWFDQKLKQGYTFAPGPKTNKTHPDLVPWENLPQESKEKDRNIVRGLPWVLAQAGFQIIHVPEVPKVPSDEG